MNGLTQAEVRNGSYERLVPCKMGIDSPIVLYVFIDVCSSMLVCVDWVGGCD